MKLSGGDSPHINLPGDSGGDQRVAAFLQEVDGALRFGGEGVEFGEHLSKRSPDRLLFFEWRNG
jgi:hypothetical protein